MHVLLIIYRYRLLLLQDDAAFQDARLCVIRKENSPVGGARAPPHQRKTLPKLIKHNDAILLVLKQAVSSGRQ